MWLFGVAVVLLSVGVVMVYSASAIVAAERFHDPFLFLKKQLFWAVLGGGALWVALRIDYRRLEKLMVPALVLAAVLLILVLMPPFGQSINGTRRWFRVGPVSFQPVEVAKLALVIYLAAFLARRREQLQDFWRGFLPPLMVAAPLAGLVLLQPDLGNGLTLVAVTFGAALPGRHPLAAPGPHHGGRLPGAGRAGDRGARTACAGSWPFSTRGRIHAGAGSRSSSPIWPSAAGDPSAAVSANRDRSSSICPNRTRTSSSPS